jgi:hypothetical protein
MWNGVGENRAAEERRKILKPLHALAILSLPKD